MAQPRTQTALQRYLDLRHRLDGGNFVNEITEIRKDAQRAFIHFDPNARPIDASILAYINRFAKLNRDINTIRSLIVPVNQLPTANHRAEAQRIYERIGRIERLRNVLREYLLQSGFADDNQLRGDQPIYAVRIPRRFRYAERQQPKGNQLIATEMITEYIPQVKQWLKQCPTADQFVAIATAANQVWQAWRQRPEAPASFDYINQFQKENERLEQVEFRIEAALELLERIANQLPQGVMSGQERDQVHRFRESFEAIRNRRNDTRTQLVYRQLATEDQLTFGFDGQLPPAFKGQPQGPGRGQAQ